MDDQDPAASYITPPTTTASPMSLVTTPSTNPSFSPRTPASPTYHQGSATGGFAIEGDSPTYQSKKDAARQQHQPPQTQESSAPTSPISRSASYTSFSEDNSTSHDPSSSSQLDAVAREIAGAGLTMGEDGTYIQTTSAHTALELKRHYDKRLGVGKPGVRSPYAITAVETAQGKTLYRLGESRPPGPGLAPTAAPVPVAAAPEVMSKSRRLRLSVVGLLAPKPPRPAPAPIATNKSVSSTSARKPPSARLVRTARSISELRPRANTGGSLSRGYKQSSVSSHSGIRDHTQIMDRLGVDGDAFSVLLGWSGDPVENHSSVSSSAGSEDSHSSDEPRFGKGETQILYPFGKGVQYSTPTGLPPDLSIRRPPSSPPQLRYMQSFESGLTARADDSDRQYPSERMSMRPSTRMTSNTHSSASPFPTEVFEVLQTFKGLPVASHLLEVSAETTFKLSSTLSAVPKNDPRFVIWGEIRTEEEEDALQSDTSSPVSFEGENTGRRRGSSSVSDISITQASASSSASDVNGSSRTPVQRVMVAATIERWIAQLTSELDYNELLDFFLTYRVYIQAIDLCQLLICRFHWALEASPETKPSSTQDEIVKKIVRVRTFIAFRYWLSTFFQVDFLKNRELCKLLTTWLNSLKADEGIVGPNQDVLDIVRKLKRIVRECKQKWLRDTPSSAASAADSSESQFSESHGERQEENVDADVDLDLGGPSSSEGAGGGDALSTTPSARSAALFPDILASPPRASDVSASTISPGPSTGGGGLSQLHDLQAAILAQAKPALHLKSTAVVAASGSSHAGALPMHQSAISRALVNTMGKLGRWKRVLHARSAMPIVAPCNDPGAFDLDVNSDSDRELGASPGGRVPLTPRTRGAAFHGGLDAYLRNASRTPPGPQKTLLGGGPRPSEDNDDGGSSVLEEIYQEAAASNAAATARADVSPQQRRLVRTASAIPLNPRLVFALETQESGSPPPTRIEIEPDSVEPVDEISSLTPTAVSATEPLSPPGLDIPAHLAPSLHRPASSSSMRRISEYKSSPLKDSSALPTGSETPASSALPEGESPDVFDAIDGDDLVIPVQSPTVAEMDAHHAGADDFEADSLVDDDEYRRGPEIVSLDDFDLSSSESGGSEAADGPPRLRRTQRRLPTRRDFEFVRRSIDSVSSLGIRSSDAHSSVASGSGLSSKSRTSQVAAAPVYEGEILPWHLDLIEDSGDEEPQGAEAALARLEGQIDSNTQKEKLKKVDRWMRMVASRMANGEAVDFSQLLEEDEEEDAAGSTAVDSSAGPSANPSLTVEMDDVHSAQSSRSGSVSVEVADTLVSVSISDVTADDDNKEEERVGPPPVSLTDANVADLLHLQREALGAVTPTPMPAKTMPGRPQLLTPTSAAPGRSDNEERDLPPSLTTSNNTVMSFVKTDHHRTSLASKRRGHNTSSLIRKADVLLTNLGPSKSISAPMIAMHRSFILMHRTEALAQNFVMIERMLFRTIKFDEIVSSTWAKHEDGGEVLDWTSYIKERAKIKVAARTKGEEPDISDVAAVRARFNIMVASTATDVVLSHPNERPAVFAKFIRIAWKSYLHNNFATVVALITGLQNPAVSVAMKRLWGRVASWEMRVFEDLKEFANPRDNFKLIRETVDVMVESRPLKSEEGPDSLNGSAASIAGKGKSGDGKITPELSCIPFIGIYLSDLHRYRKLPDYIDPTSPSSPVVIQKTSGYLSSPRYPEVFSTLAPLPASLSLEPLINVQKQRLIAGVVKNIVAGQHLASKLSFDLDGKLHHKCLRLKALPPDKLMEVAKSYGGEA